MSSTQIAHDDFRNATISTIDGFQITHGCQRIALGIVDNGIEWAFDAPREQGFYDVICHGNWEFDAPVVDTGAHRVAITSQKLAELIMAQPDYTGQAVRLVMCWVGQHDRGFAHRLDNLLGHVGVLACTGSLESDGELHLGVGAAWRFFQDGQVTTVEQR